MIDCWEKGAYEGVSDSLENRYGVKFSKTTIQRALDAVVAGLEPESRNMRDTLKNADHRGMTRPHTPIMGKSGWTRVAASPDTISYHLAASRFRATFEEHVMVPGKPATVDGYAVYGSLDVTQRCWVHTLRDAAA